MYSDKFVAHVFDKTHELISMEKKLLFFYFSKRQRAHEKLDYNLKRML